MASHYHDAGDLRIHPAFFDFVETALLPVVRIDRDAFWHGFAEIVRDLTPDNRALLARRDALQAEIDAWHQARGRGWDHAEYVRFLEDIGYLVPPGEPFEITTANVDPEISRIAGPQLVVPVSNARFALNAANARWGSLYDALYGTDVIGEEGGRERGADYNPRRGAAVIRYAADFLDRAVPLAEGSHCDIRRYAVESSNGSAVFTATLDDGRTTGLAGAEQFVGWREDGSETGYLFRNHGLHVELQVNPEHPVGRDARGNVSDVVLESAITTIQDCEDSVAAVDAEDKVAVYRNWLGLMDGTLAAAFDKGGRRMERRLAADREYEASAGGTLTLSGRSLMLVRNVGHLMTSDAVLDAAGDEVFEGMLDAVMTAACAMADRQVEGRLPNSRSGSIYIVKPKMHGPDEVAFTDRLFARVEDLLGLERCTLKVGVMDEERRTTVNLAECIRRVKDRLVFINTGFLDRTGDEIHTSMRAGPVLPKERIKVQPWIRAYEDWNVDVGIRCGLPGRAQIGKGMWPKPDEMREM